MGLRISENRTKTIISLRENILNEEYNIKWNLALQLINKLGESGQEEVREAGK